MSRPTKKAIAAVVTDWLQDPAADQGLTARRLAAYLVSERRVSELDGILREAHKQRAARGGPLEATVTTAYPLTDELRDRVQQFAVRLGQGEGRGVILDEVVDPAVIGGVKIETDDASLDTTVRRQLQRLRHLQTH